MPAVSAASGMPTGRVWSQPGCQPGYPPGGRMCPGTQFPWARLSIVPGIILAHIGFLDRAGERGTRSRMASRVPLSHLCAAYCSPYTPPTVPPLRRHAWILEKLSMKPRPLAASALYRACSLEALPFASTASLPDLDLPCGQERALQALEFGMAMPSDGFNLFVLGPDGADRQQWVEHFLRQRAAQEPVPDDWCYLFNFKEAYRPRALRLPAGDGRRLRKDLDALIGDLRSGIPALFDSEEYQNRLQELQEAATRQQSENLLEVQREAEQQQVALLPTSSGFTFAPMRDGEVVEPEQYKEWSPTERERFEAAVDHLRRKLQQALQQGHRLRHELQQAIEHLNEEMVLIALTAPIRDLQEQWQSQPRIVQQLAEIRADIVEHAQTLRGRRPGNALDTVLERYRVNVLVDHSETRGAPVVYEDLPNHQHLVGLTEHHVQQGVLYTDFSLIRQGSLHRANGGYLLIDARRLLIHPMAWESLKRALFSFEIQIESLERLYGLVTTVSLQPEPIPTRLKVVLFGEEHLYHLLSHYDPDFPILFKVAVDFEDRFARSETQQFQYARRLATMARGADLRPLDPSGVARMIEQSSRMANDQTKLSAQDRQIRDLLMQANHWAERQGATLIDASHVDRAVQEAVRRADRLYRQTMEMIERGTLLISIQGRRIAQVNGLSVMQRGGHWFGRPVRITATAVPGREQMVDIEREAELGGPIYRKAVMILSRFIAGRYAADTNLSLSASLAFEQSYAGIEGDSASVAETCALLSALSELPLQQALAVTGSLNQYGEVQAVGGVNEKIEAFFDTCRILLPAVDSETLSAVDKGTFPGVLVPASNVEHLMLRADVRAAVAAGTFHIYPIQHIDEALHLLTEVPAGTLDGAGKFPPATVNRRVCDRLARFAEIARRSGAADPD